MTTEEHIVFVVDDDPRIREALGELLAAHGMRAATLRRRASMNAPRSRICPLA